MTPADSQGIFGAFIIRNKASGTLLHLDDKLANDANIRGWSSQQSNSNAFDQLWYIKNVAGKKYYTVTNVRSGTLLDLEGGGTADGTKIRGWASNEASDQHWLIEGSNEVGYRFINVAGRKVLDLWGGSSKLGTDIVGFRDHGGDNQTWFLDRRSTTPDEINTLLKANPNFGQERFKHYVSDVLYLTLPAEVIKSIWSEKGLGSREWRPESYDCDDFVFGMKGAVTDWCYDNIRAPIAVVFGIMYGRNSSGDAHALNWYITDDLSSIDIFEPKNGTRSPSTEYNAYFGIY